MGDHLLEKAIYDTVRYFDLFEMPLTATQVWRCLIINPTGKSQMRWGGRKQASLVDIQQTLASSVWLRERVGTRWGYYFLAGHDRYITMRLERHAIAQQKWKILVSVARWLRVVPFVEALAGSGSLAIDNTKLSSDLDLFVITHGKRIWTARLLLLFVTQLMGRRRKYWNVQAPDKVCLNHYVTDDSLGMPEAVRNVYTAVQYALHVPISGMGLMQKFRRVNAAWIHTYVMVPDLPHVHHKYTLPTLGFLGSVKRAVEALLLEPSGDLLERWAGRWQRGVIARHQDVARAGRVVVSSHELAFHPDAKVPAILERFTQDAGQQKLPLTL